jgi:hypothetical protein
MHLDRSVDGDCKEADNGRSNADISSIICNDVKNSQQQILRSRLVAEALE